MKEDSVPGVGKSMAQAAAIQIRVCTHPDRSAGPEESGTLL